MPDVRVGMATGPVVARLGDVFGTTVNRASRLTAVARPNSVLVDVATVHSLADRPDVEVRQPARALAARHRPRGAVAAAPPRRRTRRRETRHRVRDVLGPAAVTVRA
ncbi:hypothetical protein GCM10025868_35910 [Angustibacter aerolatus]|uniref:Guanylate cyclase domain-containing protein n=1 Tax=Angustibacter aerolatus TaxID=1162965 RepID=A0ABQ6JNU3_9ACTN|nr:hypothetical protein GCM10025868_35910 [Angustibacter aerolatus]